MVFGKFLAKSSAMEGQAIQAEFQLFLQDLVSVEKKVIHALTDVARDILRTRPQGAPVVAAVIIDRVLKVRRAAVFGEQRPVAANDARPAVPAAAPALFWPLA